MIPDTVCFLYAIIPLLFQHKLEGALLALGQFQHALSELQSWLSHTHATLDTQRPVSSDPKAIEIELAKHHVSTRLNWIHYSLCM